MKIISLLQKRKSEEIQEHLSPEKKSRANPVKTATVKRTTGVKKPAATKPQTSGRRRKPVMVDTATSP